MEEQTVRKLRAPGIRLLFVVLVGLALTVPLLFVYALVSDRQQQAATAQAEIVGGWGGSQVLSGPIIAVPFRTTGSETVMENGKQVTRISEVEKLFYIAPVSHDLSTRIDPEERRKSIYRSVLYTAKVHGSAVFALPADLDRFGVTRERLMWDRAELRIGVSDARGLITGASLAAAGKPLVLQPGKGPAASGGQGFFAFLGWDGNGALEVKYDYGLRGSRSISSARCRYRTLITYASSPYPCTPSSARVSSQKGPICSTTAAWMPPARSANVRVQPLPRTACP